ncbi:MAG: hypothetical protein ABIJ65_04065, partial [Chloroflexota bacterium]
MSYQNGQTEMIDDEVNDILPDRLPSSLLIIGFVLVSLFGFFLVLNLLVAGRLPPFLLLMVLVGGITILYGRNRTTKGSSTTKQLYKTTSQRILFGAIGGSIATFLVYLVLQSKDLNTSWVIPFMILSIVWSLLFGIPAGGIGGLILASFWKNKRAAWIGGAIGGVLLSS